MARQRVYRHIENVRVNAIFDSTQRYRYRLVVERTTALGPVRTVCVVMQNPSYAAEEFADKSVQFLEKVIFEREMDEFQGVTRLIVVNQFALIQTTDFRGETEAIGADNDEHIADAVCESEIVVIGWGAGNKYYARQGFVLNLLRQMPTKLILQTAKHPSRGSYEDFFVRLTL